MVRPSTQPIAPILFHYYIHVSIIGGREGIVLIHAFDLKRASLIGSKRFFVIHSIGSFLAIDSLESLHSNQSLFGEPKLLHLRS